MLRGRVLPLLSLTVVFGCGLGDYERRMDYQRARLRQLEEEADLLGPYVEQPGKRLYDIQLKPPKMIAAAFNEKEGVYLYVGLNLFRYSGGAEYNLFTAAALIPKKSDALGEYEVPTEDFRLRVRGGLRQFFIRTYQMDTKFLQETAVVKETKERRGPRGEKRTALVFDRSGFDDPRKDGSHFLVYYHEDGIQQIAIVYQVPRHLANEEKTRKTIDLSLKTLVLGKTLYSP